MKASVLKGIHTAAAAGENAQLCFTVAGTEYAFLQNDKHKSRTLVSPGLARKRG